MQIACWQLFDGKRVTMTGNKVKCQHDTITQQRSTNQEKNVRELVIQFAAAPKDTNNVHTGII